MFGIGLTGLVVSLVTGGSANMPLLVALMGAAALQDLGETLGVDCDDLERLLRRIEHRSRERAGPAATVVPRR